MKKHFGHLAAVALMGGAFMGAVAPATALADTVREFRCTSADYGWKYCKTMDFQIDNCRTVGVRNLDSGANRWIKVQVRKYGEDSPRWESNALSPNEADNGRVAGTDRFTPRIYVDADGLTETAMTMRLRFSGC